MNGSSPAAPPPGASPVPPKRLALPGMVKPFPCGQGYRRWVVADVGHHQLTLVAEDGREIARFGAGVSGFTEGSGEEARFHAPRGLIAACDAIYVADTLNHAIRRIDLVEDRVETLAGTGQPGGPLRGESAGRTTALAAPWDLALRGDQLIFANAGTHQLGVLELLSGVVRPLAGSGEAGRVDGPARVARLSRPGGLAWDEATGRLYFVDRGSGSARCLDGASGDLRVESLTGEGAFRHPQGAALAGGRLWVADGGGHRLVWIDLDRRRVGGGVEVGAGAAEWWGEIVGMGEGWTSLDPEPLSLLEPVGVCADGEGGLIVSDARRHRLVRLDPGNRRMKTLFV
ncbi:MAG: hypothetical protein HQL51_06875 [Magnetococcales bacterium]|nr:hypothetical protein [Magnetococcales bacterium]